MKSHRRKRRSLELLDERRIKEGFLIWLDIIHEKFILFINHQEYFRMEFIEWDQFIMDGLGIIVLLKQIFEKFKDLIQILTRKRNFFNEGVDDFLIFTKVSTKIKRRILKQIKNYKEIKERLNKFLTIPSRNISAPKSRRSSQVER